MQSSKDKKPKIDFFLEIHLISSRLTRTVKLSFFKKWSFVNFDVFFDSFTSVFIFFDHFLAVSVLLVFCLCLQKAFFIDLGEYITGILLFKSDKDLMLIAYLYKFDLLLTSKLSELSGLTVISGLEKD